MGLVIGIDSSTQSTKAELRDIDTGELVATGRGSHPATSPPVSEQDPNAWWEALIEAVGQLGDARSEATAMSVAGQQHGLVLLDESDQPLRPAKLWNDTTSAANADSLVAEFGAQWWAETLGVVPVAAVTISKLAWVAEHENQLLDRVHKVMLPHDYLTYRLSGQHVTDRGDASGSGWFDAVGDKVLIDPLKAATGTDDWATRVPKVLGPRTAAGELQPAAAEVLGLPAGIKIGPGTGDNMAGALGLGLDPGDLVMSLGTSGTVYARTASRTKDPSGAVAGFADATGQFLPLVCTLNATKVTDTVASWLGTDAAGLATMSDELGEETVEPVLVPYFDGERTPNRPDSRGIFVGLSTTTTPGELARAAHDGVICGLLDGVDALASAGATIDGRLTLVGGGARSSAYRSRLAAISEREVFVPNDDETVALGAAVQAAAIESGADFGDITQSWSIRNGAVTEPGADSGLGQQIRERYRAAAGFDDGLCRPL